MSQWRRTTATVALIAALAGCSKGTQPSGASTSEPAAARVLPPARTLPLPGESAGVPAAVPPGDRKFLAWELPADWRAEQPSSSMRLAQYRVGGPGGDGECIVFYFGRGQGGDPLSNAARWAGQFAQPDGSDPVAAMIVTALDDTRMPVHLVEIGGTYDGGMTMTDAPAQRLEDWRLLGGIAEGPDAPWFFKFTGPAATVEAQRAAFMGLLRSLRVEED